MPRNEVVILAISEDVEEPLELLEKQTRESLEYCKQSIMGVSGVALKLRMLIKMDNKGHADKVSDGNLFGIRVETTLFLCAG